MRQIGGSGRRFIYKILFKSCDYILRPPLDRFLWCIMPHDSAPYSFPTIACNMLAKLDFSHPIEALG
jgi:hypothetical protein